MRILFPIPVLAILILTGCLGIFRGAPPLQHYTLGAAIDEEVTVANGGLARLSIGVRQPRLAEYLETHFIVVRPNPNQILFERQHRWGGSLDREIGRALVGYLDARGRFQRVDLVPWPLHVVHDYIIEVEVLRFEAVMPSDEGGSLGEAHLHASWEIVRALDPEVVASGTVDLRQPGWPVDDYPALVSRLDDSLRALADELIVRLSAQR
jgi:uncharacterized lipoprotein YmbA